MLRGSLLSILKSTLLLQLSSKSHFMFSPSLLSCSRVLLFWHFTLWEVVNCHCLLSDLFLCWKRKMCSLKAINYGVLTLFSISKQHFIILGKIFTILPHVQLRSKFGVLDIPSWKFPVFKVFSTMIRRQFLPMNSDRLSPKLGHSLFFIDLPPDHIQISFSL